MLTLLKHAYEACIRQLPAAAVVFNLLLLSEAGVTQSKAVLHFFVLQFGHKQVACSCIPLCSTYVAMMQAISLCGPCVCFLLVVWGNACLLRVGLLPVF